MVQRLCRAHHIYEHDGRELTLLDASAHGWSLASGPALLKTAAGTTFSAASDGDQLDIARQLS
jgi:hypothetical protein